MADHKTFTVFPLLPSELRLLIWDFASFVHPRVIVITRATSVSSATIQMSSPPPTLFSVCQEARYVAQKRYTLGFGTLAYPSLANVVEPQKSFQTFSPPTTWVNFAIDFIYVLEVWRNDAEHILNAISRHDKNQIRRIGISLQDKDRSIEHLLQQLEDLGELWLFNERCRDDAARRSTVEYLVFDQGSPGCEVGDFVVSWIRNVHWRIRRRKRPRVLWPGQNGTGPEEWEELKIRKLSFWESGANR